MSSALCPADGRGWVQAWQAPVSAALAAKVRELLQSVRRTEDSLLRLKRKKAQELYAIARPY